MGLMDQIRADVHQILTDSEAFGAPVVFVAPTAETVTVNCRTTKHRVSVDGDGLPVNAKHASITVSEKSLADLGYPVRNSDNEVTMKGHLVTWTDSTGLAATYIIEEWYPDETLGIIVCILGDYE